MTRLGQALTSDQERARGALSSLTTPPADPALAARLTRGTNDPERDLLAEERRELVLRAIQRLPEPLRIAVVLYEYEGLSHEQIARMTGINHAAARKRYSRALESLGKMLREALG